MNQSLMSNYIYITFFYYKSLYYGYIYVRKRELLYYTSKTVKEEGGLAYHQVHTFYENCLKFWIQVVLTNLNHVGFLHVAIYHCHSA